MKAKHVVGKKIIGIKQERVVSDCGTTAFDVQKSFWKTGAKSSYLCVNSDGTMR